MKKIGIIAGRGNFPLIFAQEAKDSGYTTVAVGVCANTSRSIRRYVDKLYWLKVTEFRRIPEILIKEGVHRVAMAGQINPYSLFDPKVMSSPDIQDFFGHISDRRADTIFNAFAKRLEESGLELIESTLFLDRYLPNPGVLSKREPAQDEYKDIDLGFKIAKHLGSIDIGQSVCVKKGVILSVEAIEGTDNAIRRAKALAGSGIILVKVSKPNQDMRFDVPVVGLRTIENLPKHSCLALEAKRTLFLDREAAIRLANKKDIAIFVKSV